jgi:uncharacterized protein YpmB
MIVYSDDIVYEDNNTVSVEYNAGCICLIIVLFIIIICIIYSILHSSRSYYGNTHSTTIIRREPPVNYHSTSLIIPARSYNSTNVIMPASNKNTTNVIIPPSNNKTTNIIKPANNSISSKKSR